MRRKAGVGAIHKQKAEQERYKEKGSEMQEVQLLQMSKQMDSFRENLEDFAAKHKNEIKKNALFRRQFQEMCAAIGVDPLASGKGFWSVLGIGDFYYELGVQIIEVCLATNYKTGGLIHLDELREKLVTSRGKGKQHQDITVEDLLTAVKKLKVLGNGFSVVPLGKGKWMVQSIPGELSLDQTAVLELASQSRGRISQADLCAQFSWEEIRGKKSLEHMLKEGLAWIDTQEDQGPIYWFPSLFHHSTISKMS